MMLRTGVMQLLSNLSDAGFSGGKVAPLASNSARSLCSSWFFSLIEWIKSQ